MVGKKLQQIKRNTFVRYWHHTALELFNYAATSNNTDYSFNMSMLEVRKTSQPRF